MRDRTAVSRLGTQDHCPCVYLMPPGMPSAFQCHHLEGTKGGFPTIASLFTVGRVGPSTRTSQGRAGSSLIAAEQNMNEE